MSLFSDVSTERLKELATYLKRFPASGEEDPEQYWYLLASTLRKRNRAKCNYSEVFLVTVGQYEDKAPLVFLKDLRKRNITLQEFIKCLEIIKCQPALNVFIEATTPEILQPVREEVVKLKAGQRLVIDVEARCKPGPLQYSWFCDNQLLLGQNSPQLSIDDITVAHQGQYCCKVTNPSINNPQQASATSPAVKVTVEEPSSTIVRQETLQTIPPPVITVHPSSVTVKRGTRPSVTFQCQAEQNVVYDWYKDGELLVGNHPTGQLVLPAVGPEQAGEYYCKVINDGGFSDTSAKATLSFVGDIDVVELCPPGRVGSPTVLRVGEELKLACTATSPSTNHLQYEWFRQDKGKLVASIGRQQAFTATVSTTNLTSKRTLQFCCKVTDRSDASNHVLSHTVEVKVETAWITEEPCDVHAVIGQRVQLTCYGEGAGDLSYTWLRASTPNARFSFHKDTKLGVLPFDKLSIRNAGYYQCQVVTQWQFVNSKVVQVKPLPSHAVTAAASQPVPVIKSVRQPRSCVVPDNCPFRLLFEVVCSTADAISYQWYFQGAKITDANSTTYVREHTCMDDCGPYWCEARAGAACVVSETARVELQYLEDQKQPHTNWEKRESERFFRTRNEERFAREKVALLIGNCNYQHEELPQLKTPENDVLAVQNVLRQAPFDFKVLSLVDLSLAEMQVALEMFYDLLSVPGTYALFYFSGHGFSTNNRNNYLVPVDSPPDFANCYQVDSIIKEMQKQHSRAILFLDACRVARDNAGPEDTSYSSIANLSNIYEEWSCMDDAFATDASESSGESAFNKAFVKAIEKKHSLPSVHDQIMQALLNSPQRPMSRTGMSDGSITLQDSIMIDDQSLEEDLDRVLSTYTQLHSVPEPHTFREAEMGDLNVFAELKLSFSLVLSNVLQVDATLHQLHGDKTSSASIVFDEEFVVSQDVSSHKKAPPPLDGQEEGLCASAVLVVKQLQKLKAPLKLLIKVCYKESGQERTTNLTYTFKDLPAIAKKCHH